MDRESDLISLSERLAPLQHSKAAPPSGQAARPTLARRTRRADLDAGRSVTPTLKRPDILEIVRTMWLSIDHKRVADKGYKQTGPEMPLQGPIRRGDVFGDLAGVLDRVSPCTDPVDMSTQLRDEAVEYVRHGYTTGKWT